MKGNCYYFVEGPCEQKLIEALKESPRLISAGRVKVFNPMTSVLSKTQLLTIQPGSTVVFAFDTDVPNTEFLRANIKALATFCKVKVVYLAQVKNLEDELVRCTDVKKITELTGTKSLADHKSRFCRMSNCRQVLERNHLALDRLWTTNPPKEFSFIQMNSNLIKGQ